MAELNFLRHTRVGVLPGICYGQTDVPLADSYRQELTDIRLAIADQGFGQVWSSPLTRCSRLAADLNRPFNISDNLMELNFGDWEMQAWGQIRDPRLQHWYDNYLTQPCPNGEGWPDLLNRVRLFINGLIEEAATGLDSFPALVITHAGVIRAASVLAGTMSASVAFSTTIGYGEIVKIKFSDQIITT